MNDFISRRCRWGIRCLIVGSLLGLASASVTFTLDKAAYRSSDKEIVATWTRSADEPVTVRDWIGFYTPEQAPTSTSQAWAYLNGTKTPPGEGVRSGKITLPLPPPGTYRARIFADDKWSQLAAEIPFTVAGGGAGVPSFSLADAGLRHAVAGVKYEGCIRGCAKDPDAGEVLAFEKVSGPAWLTVAADGTLSGTPQATDTGAAAISVRVKDAGGAMAVGAFHLTVFAPGKERVERLSVMAYNLFHGWSRVNNGSAKGIESILLAGADVVAVVESSHGKEFRPALIARELGWYYAQAPGNFDVGVASRYPILETFPCGRAVGARIRLSESPLQEVIVYSAHLDYLHYGPYEAARAGSTNESVLAEELASRRKAEAESMIAGMQAHLDAADVRPVIVAGDFNCPSHLDWTAGAAARHSGKVVAWPATVALERAGLVDSYRQQHPDPVAMPGDTWAPIYTAAEPQDRIDFVFHKGRKFKPVASRVFVTKVETQLTSYEDSGGKTIAGNTWPSDHAAVVTEYRMGE